MAVGPGRAGARERLARGQVKLLPRAHDLDHPAPRETLEERPLVPLVRLRPRGNERGGEDGEEERAHRGAQSIPAAATAPPRHRQPAAARAARARTGRSGGAPREHLAVERLVGATICSAWKPSRHARRTGGAERRAQRRIAAGAPAPAASARGRRAARAGRSRRRPPPRRGRRRGVATTGAAGGHRLERRDAEALARARAGRTRRRRRAGRPRPRAGRGSARARRGRARAACASSAARSGPSPAIQSHGAERAARERAPARRAGRRAPLRAHERGERQDDELARRASPRARAHGARARRGRSARDRPSSGSRRCARADHAALAQAPRHGGRDRDRARARGARRPGACASPRRTARSMRRVVIAGTPAQARGEAAEPRRAAGVQVHEVRRERSEARAQRAAPPRGRGRSRMRTARASKPRARAPRAAARDRGGQISTLRCPRARSPSISRKTCTSPPEKPRSASTWAMVKGQRSVDTGARVAPRAGGPLGRRASAGIARSPAGKTSAGDPREPKERGLPSPYASRRAPRSFCPAAPVPGGRATTSSSRSGSCGGGRSSCRRRRERSWPRSARPTSTATSRPTSSTSRPSAAHYSHCHRWTIVEEMRELAKTPRRGGLHPRLPLAPRRGHDRAQPLRALPPRALRAHEGPRPPLLGDERRPLRARGALGGRHRAQVATASSTSSTSSSTAPCRRRRSRCARTS